MYDTETKLKHGKLSQEMLDFYHALGTFNTNIIARLIEDPKAIGELIKELVHDAVPHEGGHGCNDGYIYDHTGGECKPVGGRAPEEPLNG